MAADHTNRFRRARRLASARLAVAVPAVVIALVAAAPNGASARTGGGHSETCEPGHRGLLAIDPHAQVWVAKEGTELLGCVLGHDRTVALGPVVCLSPDCSGISEPVLTGYFAAFEYYRHGSPSSYTVEVVDLRTGRRRVTPSGIAGGPVQSGAETGGIAAIVCTGAGDAAWIAFNGTRSETGELVYDVYAYDDHGLRLLDSGTGVAESSLALAGRTVYWTDGGQPRSATLE